ncbi:cell wall-associated NlpC family hydrolase [Alkalihalobacillus xiaoxiensis]|uniref:Cell wall-associated NlpC family hydrolase n=1 Tax=Shouchella xiaoxiensis TaxID=766895 RepID=A0ABS2ST30_9BACI|nr:C40 family peptidase [Shouchella xiaoxiensis]MBM7838667.1 cell wall-associated NlpC family hydrolase [Shouchella xiaoxiensis]
MEEMKVNVPVATLWTSPESPRDVDLAAIQTPTFYEQWLEKLTFEQRLQLCTNNLVQSQVLFNETVLVLREENGWAEVLLPNQPTLKNIRGYPGWIPFDQLTPFNYQSHKEVRIKSTAAKLKIEGQQHELKLSYGTVLPVFRENENNVSVQTPLGKGYLNKEDIEAANETYGSEMLVDSARRFIGLPYLWGGMSSFGYDCSGYVYAMHRSINITIPRDASNQVKTGKNVQFKHAEPGDLLYFAYEEGQGAVHHVAMYTGNGRMIHAPKTGKTIEEIELNGTVYEKEHCATRRFVGASNWRDLA